MSSPEALIIKNTPREGPGVLQSVLNAQGISYDIMERSGTYPSPTDYGAVFVFGGPDSANDDTPEMRAELALIEKTLEQGVPYFGVCLGLQTLVKAAGGKVVKSAVKEVGFLDEDGENFEIDLTPAGRQDPLFDSVSDNVNVFHLHGETVEPADGAEVLAIGKHCVNQVVKVAPRAYGAQPHFELTPSTLRDWIHEDPDLHHIGEEALTGQFSSIRLPYELTGRQIFYNFLTIAGLAQ